jgi:tetratricopeptide (TPR) repeat protein
VEILNACGSGELSNININLWNMRRLKIIVLITTALLAINSSAQTQKKAKQQSPETYFKLAKGFFEKKNYQEAAINFEKSVEYADRAGETKIADTSRLYLAGIYTVLGNTDLKNDSLDQAIENYSKSLSYKPDFSKAYYGLGLVYKKQDDLSKMKKALDMAIKLAGDDNKTIVNAKDAAASAFQKAGAVALQAGNFSAAIENLNSSLEYNIVEPRTYLYLAVAYNSLLKWDDAINMANKALKIQTGDKSDIYFELGISYAGKGDLSKTCYFYSMVKTGKNAATAKYQFEQVLKCKQE